MRSRVTWNRQNNPLHSHIFERAFNNYRFQDSVFLRRSERRTSSGAAIGFDLYLPYEATSEKKMENRGRHDVIFLNIP
jgi:hypothetical protein